MMKLGRVVGLTAAVWVSQVGCTDGGTRIPDRVPDAGVAPSLTAWLGQMLHVRTDGTVAASVIGANPSFDLDATETASVARCGRQYRVTDPNDETTWDDGNGRLTELELTLEVEVGGEEREYEVGFESDDFRDFRVGEVITVAPDPDDGSDPPTGQAWAEFQGEWEDATGQQIEFEEKALGGMIVIGELSGGTGGLVVPDGAGRYGAFFRLDFDGGTSLVGSFTAPCGENDVEAFGD